MLSARLRTTQRDALQPPETPSLLLGGALTEKEGFEPSMEPFSPITP